MGFRRRGGRRTVLLTLTGRFLLPLIGPNLRKEYLGFASSGLGEDYMGARTSSDEGARVMITTGESSSSSSSVALNNEPSAGENSLRLLPLLVLPPPPPLRPPGGALYRVTRQ